MKPILFSTPMVQAILQGRKTQTRRTVKPQPSLKMGVGKWLKNKILQMVGDQSVVIDYMEKHNPFGQPGEILWVRESGWVDNNYLPGLNEPHCYWKADYENYEDWEKKLITDHYCRFNSIHMTKECCRIFLKIKSIRVERLQSISESDAVNEGIKFLEDTGMTHPGWEDYSGKATFCTTASGSFRSLWDLINGKKHPWESNPWVWVVEFQHIEKTWN